MSAEDVSGPTRRSVVRDSLSVGVATGAYGVSFGALSVTSGFSVVQTCVLSLLVFTGASQFALIGVVASGGNPLTGAAHLVIDESTAMSVAQPDRELAKVGFLVTGVSVFVLWNVATFAGAVGGEAIGDPRTYGLDAAVGAGLPRPAVAAPDREHRTARRPARGAAGPRSRTGDDARDPRAGGGHGGRRSRPAEPRLVIWAAVLITAVGCYLLKLLGLSVPEQVLEHPAVRRVADLIPVALLSALVAVQVFADGARPIVDARLAGVAVAVVECPEHPPST